MQQISISDIQRNLHKLEEFDIIEIVDKKRNKVKGYFVDSKYTSLINKLMEAEKDNRSLGESLAGSLHEYANPDLIAEEEGAWQKHLIKKYQP